MADRDGRDVLIHAAVYLMVEYTWALPAGRHWTDASDEQAHKILQRLIAEVKVGD